ncbi:SDR family NAD(P)-dependent oxidoreductase [Antribacter gilvus]|uniref:SDR family NAD(P)-dependent oxidoreductase n=1 Tax=Antribacter gilvus TaxID=2304675 RepID=UPI000F7B5C6E|nr:SDR family oxidoreductase [Antribacter gilvus]
MAEEGRQPVGAGADAGAGAAEVAPARTALVTGASRGIGREIALGLARAGIHVALLARDAARLEAVATEVAEAGAGQDVRAVAIAADVTSFDDVTSAVRRAEEALGGVDLLVNNAGRVDAEVPLWEADPDEWWGVFETNVRGPFWFSRLLVPAMLSRGGGRVVELSSGAATNEMSGTSAYNGSKTALLRLGANLHASGYPLGLRVFEVAPGVVPTDMATGMQLHAGRTEWTPVERTVDMVTTIARGELDACSGWYIRVTDDTPASLRELAGQAGTGTRRLRVQQT